MPFLDLFSDTAGLYASARPTYPDDLFRFVASIAPSRDRVWDCGTGNGKAAVGLARHFNAVWATDASAEQIAHAMPCEGVSYSVQPAEKTEFPSSSFDAACVAQALHWFDFDQFYPEVRRVLRPSGAFAAWGYDWFSVSPEFDERFMRSVRDVIGPYWAPQNALVWNGYRDMPFPFKRVTTPKLSMRVWWTFPQMLAFVHTWSAMRRCITHRGPASFERAAAELLPLWGKPDQAREVAMPLHVLAGHAEP